MSSLLQVRNVPERTRRALKARAAAQGESMNSYVLSCSSARWRARLRPRCWSAPVNAASEPRPPRVRRSPRLGRSVSGASGDRCRQRGCRRCAHGRRGQREARGLSRPGGVARPSLLDFEVVAALRGLTLGGHLSHARAADALSDFDELMIERWPFADPLRRRAFALRENISVIRRRVRGAG